VVLKDFYATTAQASFTVLSVWWVILGLFQQQWLRDARQRLVVYDISLYFLLPGMMSLVSLLAVEVPEFWRVAFAVAGVVGAVESAVLPIRRRPHGPSRVFLHAADWLSFGVYALIALVALWPASVAKAGIALQPLEVEGALIAGLLILGFTLIWMMFVSAASAADEAPAETTAALKIPQPAATSSRRRSA
jgi:hypothetical protein